MAESPTRITPYLVYADAAAAIEFLGKAFGFEERMRFAMPDGRIGHAELVLDDDCTIFLASVFEDMGLASPKDLAAVHCQIHCQVPDVDSHYDRARSAGATIAAEPEDQFYGDRMYRAVDPEGHRWMFSTHVRDVPPEEWPEQP
jgi:PhnB protein